jgi:hypothetical protein
MTCQLGTSLFHRASSAHAVLRAAGRAAVTGRLVVPASGYARRAIPLTIGAR